MVDTDDGAGRPPGTLLAACVVDSLLPDAGPEGVTAIDKRAVDGPIAVRTLGLYADIQVSRKHHGGPDKALYAYAQEDADYWAIELNRELPAGWFGENLRTAGIDLTNARIGEQWRIGAGDSAVVLEVTMPRTPCQTFARWVGGADERGWVKRFSVEARTGAYLRVVRTGRITAGDAIAVVAVPAKAPTIREVFTS